MDHGKPHNARPNNRILIDLGNEPPLSVDGEPGGPINRRRISVQWFSGTILTGFCGAALMGGAVFASLDGETTFASVPERIEGALRGALNNADRLSAGIRKGDKLPAAVEPNVARHAIRVTTTSQVGNREIVRVRPYVRVAGNLALAKTDLSANIPPFNPQRMLVDAGTGEDTAAANAEPDAEVSFVMRDLASVLPRAKIAISQSTEDILTLVRQAAKWTGPRPRTTLASIDPKNLKLAYATEGNIDPYGDFGARIVPENVTLLPKTATQTSGGHPWSERVITVKKGDGLTQILRDLGATEQEARAIVTVFGSRGRDGGLREGQKLRVLLSPVQNGSRLQPLRVIIASDAAVEAVAALADIGKYVSVDVRAIDSDVAEAKDDEEEDDGKGIRLYQSLYETALRNQLPPSVIDNLIRVYSYDVDYQRKVQPGDSFEVFFTAEDEAPGAEGRTEIAYASLTVGGETHKFYRFQSPDDGVVDFYDETGKSAKKFLVRKPVANGIMRSGFGFRRHPILGLAKMHTGVDWAAPTGTPIYAAGNGVVEKAGQESGYGKYIKLRHANGYETAYGHLTAFARGMEPGVQVRQGQVIGFVGSTGMSTGAHVHYEIFVNGRFVDPMRIRLPRGRVLDGPMLGKFAQERNRIDAMLARASSSRLAQSIPATR